jgi:hypothetical protein
MEQKSADHVEPAAIIYRKFDDKPGRPSIYGFSAEMAEKSVGQAPTSTNPECRHQEAGSLASLCPDFGEQETGSPTLQALGYE